MSQSELKIFDVQYNNVEKRIALDRIMDLMSYRKKANVFFLNANCLYISQRDKEYKNILNNADLLLPDGIGIKLTTIIFGGRMREDCNGTDFCPLLMQEMADKEYKMYFLGAREGVAEKAAENVRKQIPRIQIVGTNSGYFDNDEEMIKRINESGANILFVAMGVPLQEKWIARNREKLNPRLCLGVGALFDYLSGRIPRAPKFMRAMHLEWLWRIFIEPKRMFKRYIIDGAKLGWIVFKYKINGVKLQNK